MPLSSKGASKTFTADFMVLVLASIQKTSGKLPAGAEYKIIAQLSNGEHTESALEHMFRELKKEARALVESGAADVDDAIGTPKKRTSKSTTTTPKSGSKKSGKKDNNGKKAGDNEDTEDDEEELPATPRKRAKTDRKAKSDAKVKTEDQSELNA